mmetsp:Transcript_4725/g.8379  ORF Transcript_4725/g.8379 Transcript_4725/m.8379 type:complete len:368 (+) Transcript_4725:1921-3024(+)
MKRRFDASSPSRTSNKRVTQLRPLIPPAILLEEIPISDTAETVVDKARQEADAIVMGMDDRLIVVVGPCSIHDTQAAIQYANELKVVSEELKGELLVIMRVYFEKPRTTVGWKGMINDPDMNGTFDINKGLRKARKLLVDINELGLPVGCEFLDSISPQFISDLTSWGAIGARTVESQIHRELASGLSCPIGFKNGTGGSVQVALDAIKSASNPHSFLGVTEQGLAAIVTTVGNQASHVILRGGSDGPNFAAEAVNACKEKMVNAGISNGIVVDCSHGNSNKDHKNQPKVAASICEQVKIGSRAVVGVMIESNINEGKQSLEIGKTDPKELKFGVSVTDACIDIETTKAVLKDLAAAVRARRELPSA